MGTRLSGYQPQYFPRLHYFARMLDSDIFEISDYLQFVRKHAYRLPDGTNKRGKSYQAHTPIKLQSGVNLLSIPTHRDGLLPINETRIDYSQNWVTKHLRNIEAGYSRAPRFAEIFPELKSMLETGYVSLAHLNIITVLWALARIFGQSQVRIDDLAVNKINTLLLEGKHPFRLRKVVLMSETEIQPAGEGEDANDWIIEVCRNYGADEYYFGGTASAAYMDFNKYDAAGIKLVEQNWKGLEYAQQFPQTGFVANLSIVDLLMNADNEQVVEVLAGA